MKKTYWAVAGAMVGIPLLGFLVVGNRPGNDDPKNAQRQAGASPDHPRNIGPPYEAAPAPRGRGGAGDRPVASESDVDLAPYESIIGAFEEGLKAREKAGAEVLASYDYEGAQNVEIALRGPTSREIKEEFNNAVARAGKVNVREGNALKLELRQKAEMFATPEGAVCRVLMVSLHSGNGASAQYYVVGVSDLSQLRLVNGRFAATKMIPTPDSGLAPLGSRWRYRHLVDLE